MSKSTLENKIARAQQLIAVDELIIRRTTWMGDSDHSKQERKYAEERIADNKGWILELEAQLQST